MPSSSLEAAVLELEAGARDEVFHGARDEDLAGLGVCRYAGAGVDGDAHHLAVDELALAGVQAGAYFESELAHGLADRAGTADCAAGSVERGQKAVADGVDL